MKLYCQFNCDTETRFDKYITYNYGLSLIEAWSFIFMVLIHWLEIKHYFS